MSYKQTDDPELEDIMNEDYGDFGSDTDDPAEIEEILRQDEKQLFNVKESPEKAVKEDAPKKKIERDLFDHPLEVLEKEERDISIKLGN
jgi:hypothetical protein